MPFSKAKNGFLLGALRNLLAPGAAPRHVLAMSSQDEASPPHVEHRAEAGSPDFTCQACGGRMNYDASTGCMLCVFCGSTRAIGEKKGELIAEYDLEHGLEPARGLRNDTYDDLLVCASKGLPRKMARKLEPFETRELSPYDPSYLAGWRAEEYSVHLNSGWGLALERIEETQRQRCSGNVPGDTQRNLHVPNLASDERFKHILLPVWISAYRYRGKPFQFLVNGQTGEVTGHAPWSTIKVALLCVALAAVALVVFLLLQR